MNPREGPAIARDSLDAVRDDIVGCARCPRLRRHCRKTARDKVRRFRDQEYWGRPVPGFGDPGARLLLVGLAPAAHGGNRTGRVFTGDDSGDWLFAALHEHGFASRAVSTHAHDGLVLRDCYITASARCAPPQNRPTRAELWRCRPFLRREMALLTRVRVVLALGRIGHETWLRAAGHWDALAPGNRPAFAHGAEAVLPDGTVLIASYHPSRQNTNTGRLTRVMWRAVFAAARRHVDAANAG